jgi:glycosyltransferase involved in cell wall biosynthesis
MPLISIITINLNNQNGLLATIDSVRNQSFKDYEYIVIDGGSIDGSESVIQENQDIISYWCSEPDRGIYHAMNKGILAAKGTFLLFLNSGDFLVNDNVLSVVSKYLTSQVCIVYGNLKLINSKGNIKLMKFPSMVTNSFFMIKFLPHPAAFIKRDTILLLSLFDESYKIAADHAFFIKAILAEKLPYLHINIVITKFNVEGISLQRQYKKLVYRERDRALYSNLSLAKYIWLKIMLPFYKLYWGLYFRLLLI